MNQSQLKARNEIHRYQQLLANGEITPEEILDQATWEYARESYLGGDAAKVAWIVLAWAEDLVG